MTAFISRLSTVTTILFVLMVASPAFAGPAAPSGSSAAQAAIAADITSGRRPDPAEARKLYDEGATFVDVRTDREWAGGRVKGAIHIPVKDVATEAAAKLPDKSLPIVTYCAAGPRAAKGAATLRKLGYKNVVAMTSGYPEWKAANYPVELPK